jgi:hypothetical protein
MLQSCITWPSIVLANSNLLLLIASCAFLRFSLSHIVVSKEQGHRLIIIPKYRWEPEAAHAISRGVGSFNVMRGVWNNSDNRDQMALHYLYYL